MGIGKIKRRLQVDLAKGKISKTEFMQKLQEASRRDNESKQLQAVEGVQQLINDANRRLSKAKSKQKREQIRQDIARLQQERDKLLGDDEKTTQQFRSRLSQQKREQTARIERQQREARAESNPTAQELAEFLRQKRAQERQEVAPIGRSNIIEESIRSNQAPTAGEVVRTARVQARQRGISQEQAIRDESVRRLAESEFFLPSLEAREALREARRVSSTTGVDELDVLRATSLEQAPPIQQQARSQAPTAQQNLSIIDQASKPQQKVLSSPSDEMQKAFRDLERSQKGPVGKALLSGRDFFTKTTSKLSERQDILLQKQNDSAIQSLKRDAKLAGLEFTKSFTELGVFGTALAVSPKKTVVSTATGLKTVAKKAIKQKGFPGLGEVIKQKPGLVIGRVTSEIVLAKGLGRAARLSRQTLGSAATRISPKFRPVVTDPLGVKKVAGIKGIPKGELGLIPEKEGLTNAVNVGALLQEARVTPVPKNILSDLTPAQRKVVSTVSSRGDVISGRVSQAATVGKVPKSKLRKTDLDILSTNPSETASLLKTTIPDMKFTQQLTAITGKSKGVSVDIVPLKLGEQGLATKFPTVDIAGTKFVNPQARLASKAIQFGQGKRTSKIAQDIKDLSGIDVPLTSPVVRGGFGFSRAEQAAFIGKTGPISTSQRSIIPLLGRKFVVGPGEANFGLFATPFEMGTGRAVTRASRLGTGKDASLLDILSGQELSLRAGRPQILIFKDQTVGKNFLPFGMKGGELEVTLPPGNIVQADKLLARTIINNRPVKIFEASIVGDAASSTSTLNRVLGLPQRAAKRPKSSRGRSTQLPKVVRAGTPVSFLGQQSKSLNKILGNSKPFTVSRGGSSMPKMAGKSNIVSPRGTTTALPSFLRKSIPITSPLGGSGTSKLSNPLRNFGTSGLGGGRGSGLLRGGSGLSTNLRFPRPTPPPPRLPGQEQRRKKKKKKGKSKRSDRGFIAAPNLLGIEFRVRGKGIVDTTGFEGVRPLPLKMPKMNMRGIL